MADADVSAASSGDSPSGPKSELGRNSTLVSTVDVLRSLLRHPRISLGFPAVLGLLGFLFFQFFGSYVAESSLTPGQSGLSLSSLAGLAAQFGVNIPAGAGTQDRSIDFYVAVLRSPELLAEVGRSEYRFAKEPGGRDSLNGSLIQLLDIGGDTPEDRLRGVIKVLENRVSVTSDRLAGIIVIRVKSPWRELAQQVNRRMLELLNQFNVQKRQSMALAERQFVEQRLAGAQAELVAAEDSVQRFLEQNRTYQNSPRLAFEVARLQRRVDLRQQVYTTLAQSYEQARIEEVRNTPIITIIQRPELYTRRSRSQFKMGLLAAFVGAVMSLSLVLFLEFVGQQPQIGANRMLRLREAFPLAWRKVLPRRWSGGPGE